MALAEVRCEQCGQLDDHPMVHIMGGRSVHHDCLSYAEKQMVIGSSPVAAQIIEECEGGLKGDELRHRIEEIHAALPVELPTPTVPEETGDAPSDADGSDDETPEA